MRSNLDSTGYDKKRTITMTFRIEKDIMANLRREAGKRGISLNMLVNQIFKNFVDWYIFETKIGMIPMPKPVILELFKNLSKEEVIDISARIGKSEIYDIVLFMKTKVDMDSFIEWISTRMRNSSMHITHMINGNTHVYTMKHNVCLNWSLYHKIILQLIFDEIIGKEVEIDISETAFTIRFEK
jgi:hypothetical protein